jgi:hypothetical protein
MGVQTSLFSEEFWEICLKTLAGFLIASYKVERICAGSSRPSQTTLNPSCKHSANHTAHKQREMSYPNPKLNCGLLQGMKRLLICIIFQRHHNLPIDPTCWVLLQIFENLKP